MSDYSERKAQLKILRNGAGKAFGSWRTCVQCTDPLKWAYCPMHRAALDMYQSAQGDLREHITGSRRRTR